MARRSSRKKSGRSVDFSQEVKYFEPDMEVELEVKSAEWEDGNEHPYIAIVFKGVDEHEDAELYHNASASPKSLSRLRSLLEAFGMEVPDGPLDIDTDELVGMRCMAHTYEDEYRNNDGEKKKTVRADDFWAVEKSTKAGKKSSKKDDDGEDDKKSSKKGGKKSKLEPIAKDDVPDDRDELDELVEKYSLDIEMTRKLKKDDEAYQEAVIEALEEAGMLEEEEKPKGKRGAKKDDEDEGKSGRSGRGSKKSGGKSKTWSEDDIADMNEEQLDEVVEQAKIDLDLSDHRTLRKKKNALIDALEEAGKLAD
jgi:hypothetical protein